MSKLQLYWLLLIVLIYGSDRGLAATVHSVKGNRAIVVIGETALSLGDSVEFLDSIGDQVAVGEVIKLGAKRAKVKVTLGKARKGNWVARLISEQETLFSAAKAARAPQKGLGFGIGAGFGTELSQPPAVCKLQLYYIIDHQWIGRMGATGWFGTESTIELRWSSLNFGAGWQLPSTDVWRYEVGLWFGYLKLASEVRDGVEVRFDTIEDGYGSPYFSVFYKFKSTVQLGFEIERPVIFDGTDINAIFTQVTLRRLF